MPILDKARIKSGVEAVSKLDLSHEHITTTNFMDLQPVMYRHMIPGEKIVVNAKAFARLAPMAVPTYGRCRLNLRCFFVPFRTVFKHFTDFIEDTVSQKYSSTQGSINGIVTSTPILPNSALFDLFTNAVYSTSTGASSSHYDFVLDNGGTPIYYLFTPFGRQTYKILRSLGYEVIWNKNDGTVYSALALLSFLRVYCDWYSLSAYLNQQDYQLFMSYFAYDTISTPLTFDFYGLNELFQLIHRVNYEGDYFISAWDNPVAPNNSLFSNFVIPDITVNGGGDRSSSVRNDFNTSTYPNPNHTPVVIGVTGSSTSQTPFQFSQYADDALKALTDYMKAHQLAGARAIDRYLADYGINLPADKLNRSVYLGMSSIDIKVGDVMSHADTSSGGTSNLGDYAGQGYMDGNKTFEFQTSEFGLFLICASIVPNGGIVQGYDRNNLHTTKDQFYNAKFDCLGVQTLNKGEVFISKLESYASPGDYNKAFGYVPRYAEYKVAREQLSGDLSLASVISGKDSWHLFRILDENSFTNISNQLHSAAFCRGDDAWQYSRIFNSTDPAYDKFYVYYNFKVISRCPCKSLFDTYEFDSEGKELTLQANGVKMN